MGLGEIIRLAVAHREDKPEHILIGADFHARLCDLELNKRRPVSIRRVYAHFGDTSPHIGPFRVKPRIPHPEQKWAHSIVGTSSFIAPEIVAQCGHGTMCDWWLLGVVTYAYLVGNNLAKESCKHSSPRVKNIGHLPNWGALLKNAQDFVSQLTEHNRVRLVGADAVAAHPFLRGLTSEVGPQRSAPLHYRFVRLNCSGLLCIFHSRLLDGLCTVVFFCCCHAHCPLSDGGSFGFARGIYAASTGLFS